MTSALTKQKPEDQVVDGFAGFEDRIEGDEHQQSGGVIVGAMVKFSNEAAWVARDRDQLPPELELIAVDISRIVQKWRDQMPVETIVLQPGQKFPDIADLNEKTPRNEWGKGPMGSRAGRGRRSMSSTSSARIRWTGSRFQPAPSAERSPFASWSIRRTGCGGSVGRMSIQS
jgi:hypothetical protein